MFFSHAFREAMNDAIFKEKSTPWKQREHERNKQNRIERETRTARSNIAPPQSLAALGADEVEPAEVVAFAERLLAVGRVDGEEFLRDDVAAVHAFEAV